MLLVLNSLSMPPKGEVLLFANLATLVVFQGRGTVATGRVEQGIVKVGDEVEILGLMQVKIRINLLLLHLF